MAAKSIVLAQAMWSVRPAPDQGFIDDPKPSFLHFNDPTFGRHLLRSPSTLGCALAGTLGEYVPPEATESGNLRRIQEVPQPTDEHLDFAKRLPRRPSYYDKVILDVDTVGEQLFPSEQNSPQETIPEMTERYRAAYVELLLTALDAVKIGGRVVYCAPSTAKDEHDIVVFRALYRRTLMSEGIDSGVVELERVPDKLKTELEEWAEQTKQGWHVLPTKPVEDTQSDPVKDMQFGPYYIAVIKKNARRRGSPQ